MRVYIHVNYVEKEERARVHKRVNYVERCERARVYIHIHYVERERELYCLLSTDASNCYIYKRVYLVSIHYLSHFAELFVNSFLSITSARNLE